MGSGLVVCVCLCVSLCVCLRSPGWAEKIGFLPQGEREHFYSQIWATRVFLCISWLSGHSIGRFQKNKEKKKKKEGENWGRAPRGAGITPESGPGVAPESYIFSTMCLSLAH